MENIKLKDLKNKKFHFIGIGGISMSGLAMMLKRDGFFVQGSDLVCSEETKKLEKNSVKVFYEHNKNNLKDIDIVVYSSAILDDNEELKFAKNNKLILLKRAELLGLLSELYKVVIAVSGSHGKTTTTAMISEIFIKADLKPTIHLGGVLNSISSNYKLGNRRYFITEACEYKDNYLYIQPDIAVILNIDLDHLDYFKNINNLKDSFLKFSKRVKPGGIVVVSADDENSKGLVQQKNIAMFGSNKRADVYAVNIKEYKPCYYSFDVMFSRFKLGNIKLNIVGKHNVKNAVAAILVSLACGIDFCDIKEAIENFSSVKRRCEKVCEINGFSVYHDYAHHPEQIKKMIEVGRDLTKKKKGNVIVVFEPHTYSRTKHLIDEFSGCFANCDKVIIAPVYFARENPIQGYDSMKLFNEIKSKGISAEYIETYKEIKARTMKVAKPDDVVLILGAGSIEKLAKMF